MPNGTRKKRKYFTKEQKKKILMELDLGVTCQAELARKHDLHPITICNWKRTMKKDEPKKSEANISELLEELEKAKAENENLKKALGEIVVEKQILKSTIEVLKKEEIKEKTGQRRKLLGKLKKKK